MRAPDLGRLLHRDIGRSIISNKQVSEELAQTIGPSIELIAGAMLITISSGIALGILAGGGAWQRPRSADHRDLGG
jgi:ABC-type dipeptide/oligopeptide/nickel transport system permease component